MAGFRFFERWAGDELVKVLRTTFAGYDAEDVAGSLRAKAELFGKLEDDVVQRFGFVALLDRGEIFRRLDVLAPP